MRGTSSGPEKVGGSFRDPAGYVFQEEGVLKRAVTAHGQPDYDAFLASGLYHRLVEESLIVRHEEQSGPAALPGIHRILIPEQLPYISYPYEWCFGQLQDAALLTLRIQELALEHGMSLKDASGFNVQFRGYRPLFIDTLSFEKNDGGPWPAYNQFCRHFLAPLLLMARLDPSFNRFWKSSLDGIPLDLASAILPPTSYFSFGSLVHIHLHSRSQRRYADPAKATAVAKTVKLSGPDRKSALGESLKSTIEGIKLARKPTEWVEYYQHASHYSPVAEQAKKTTVSRMIERIGPSLMYDFGGNIGDYSRLATKRGIDAVCFDIDPLCVQHNYERSKLEQDTHMLALLTDLANPSPALGFALEERTSFFDRATPDLVIALALIHHLRITCNVPLARLAECFAKLTRNLIIEYVPKDDVMVQALLRNRKDTFLDYDKQAFLREFRGYFSIEEEVSVPETTRCLYLLRRTK